MRVRHTLPTIAFVSAMSFGAMVASPAMSAAQDRGYQDRGYRGTQRSDYSSSLRFNVNPNRAEVFVDGSLAGRVDDFDGLFQRLNVRPGNHDVVVYLDGYRTGHERVYVAPSASRTVTMNLQRLGRGERGYGRPADRGAGDWWDPRYNDSSARLGVVSLGLAPYDSEVWVDGRRWSNTVRNRYERMALRLAPGRHRIEVRRPGYQTYARDLNVATGGTVTLNVSLRRG